MRPYSAITLHITSHSDDYKNTVGRPVQCTATPKLLRDTLLFSRNFSPVARVERTVSPALNSQDAVLHPEHGDRAGAGPQGRGGRRGAASDNVRLPRGRQSAVGVQGRHDPQQVEWTCSGCEPGDRQRVHIRATRWPQPAVALRGRRDDQERDRPGAGRVRRQHRTWGPRYRLLQARRNQPGLQDRDS